MSSPHRNFSVMKWRDKTWKKGLANTIRLNTLTSEAEIKAYLDEAMTIGEPNLISAVLDDIAKARSMAKPCKNASDLGEIE
nr:hypothetical protein [Aeromonas caviae]